MEGGLDRTMPTPEIKIATDRIVKAAVEGWLVGSPNSEFRRIVEAILVKVYKAGKLKGISDALSIPREPWRL